MISKVSSGCLIGIDAHLVDVEVDVSGGLPGFSVIGLPDASIRESRDRIRSAIKNSGLTFPSRKITVNLSPADTKKEGAGFDLPIALGILSATGLIEQEMVEGTLFCGELSLNGMLKHFRGALPLAISLKDRYEAFIVPKANAPEAAIAGEMRAYGASSLMEVIEHLKGVKTLEPVESSEPDDHAPSPYGSLALDFHDVKGQKYSKRALEVAASGQHNILLIGPPGAGKSMLATRFSSILPELSRDEALETSKIYSIAGELKGGFLVKDRPFRAPHHTISYAAMTGGGSWPLPGEISLAHNGVLFLDEFPEFRRNVLETLRQPIESGKISISRVKQSVTYPSRFVLIAAMNPCPCGYFTDPQRACQCTSLQIQRYLSKISGPLLDRIDIHLEVPRLSYENLSGKRTGESSVVIKNRVLATGTVQKKRFKEKPPHIGYNAYMTSKEVEKFCALSGGAEEILKSAILELGISARAYDKILKISRTIADMNSSELIESHHISEAIGYRCLDRNLWG